MAELLVQLVLAALVLVVLAAPVWLVLAVLVLVVVPQVVQREPQQWLVLQAASLKRTALAALIRPGQILSAKVWPAFGSPEMAKPPAVEPTASSAVHTAPVLVAIEVIAAKHPIALEMIVAKRLGVLTPS